MDDFGPHDLASYLLVAVVLFCAGVLAVATRRNAIGVLIGLELMLNAAALQFAAYGHFRAYSTVQSGAQGQTAAVFVLVVAAAEAAVALSLLFAVYRTSKDIDLERTQELGS